MQRLTTSLKQIFNPAANPIIVKELRSRMRGARAFIILTAVLLLMAVISYALYQLVILTATWNYAPLSPQIGQSMFSALMLLEMLMICLITPAITSGAISSEHENLTYEMLLTTPLKPTRILWGKLVSAMSYVFLLIFAAVPMASLVFLYGGVAPVDMLNALIVLLSTAIMLGTIGIFMSTWLKRTGRATVLSYLVVLFLLGAPSFFYGIMAIIRGNEPPRWLLVASPINALFSAITPATSLGNSAMGFIGGVSMLMAGNLNFMETNSIPRPLYHYTLPLYGIITITLYLLATRLVRPARRWRMRAKDLLMGALALLIFIGAAALFFGLSRGQYENHSIFAAPTPFIPMREEAIKEAAFMQPVSDAEVISIYSAALASMQQEELLPEITVAVLSRLTYFDPAAPVLDNENTLDEALVEGITVTSDNLPFDLIWVDNFEMFSLEDLADPDKKGDVLILFGPLNPLKTGLITLDAAVYYPDESSQALRFDLANPNGFWEVVNFEISQGMAPTSAPEAQTRQLTFDEMAEIYAAALAQAYLADNPAPETEITTFYLLQTTGLAVDSITLPPEVQTEITAALAVFPFQTTWVENHAEVSQHTATAGTENHSASVTFGYILPHDTDGAVEVMIEVDFGAGNGVLATYILEKIDGEWQVTEFGGMG